MAACLAQHMEVSMSLNSTNIATAMFKYPAHYKNFTMDVLKLFSTTNTP
jgi:hypothetical protein